MSKNYDRIFWAEAHNEIQALPISEEWRIKRLITFFLISDKVLFHPAYLWRSDSTHTIVFQNYNRLFIPDHTQIIVSGRPSVESYILSRIDALSKSEHPISETEKYTANLDNIAKDVPYLDNTFKALSSKYGLEIKDRDKVFRKALISELGLMSPYALRTKIVNTVEKYTRARCSENIFDTLIKWVNSSHFVSHEAFILQLASVTSLPAVLFAEVRLHTLNIYLSSAVEASVQVPFLRKAHRLFDPLDPEIFFFYLRTIVGKDVFSRHIQQRDWNKISEVIIAFRTEPLWAEAKAVYLNALIEYNEVILSDINAIRLKLKIAAFQEHLGFIHLNLHKSRLSLLGVLFGVIGLDATTGILQGIGMVGGIGVGIYDVVRFYRALVAGLRSTLRARLIMALKAKSVY